MQCAGPVVQLLSAGVVLEDVSLWNVSGNSELLAALGPAAGTLESLSVDLHDGCRNVQDDRDMEVSGDLPVFHSMADRPSLLPHQALHAIRCGSLALNE